MPFPAASKEWGLSAALSTSKALLRAKKRKSVSREQQHGTSIHVPPCFSDVPWSGKKERAANT